MRAGARAAGFAPSARSLLTAAALVAVAAGAFAFARETSVFAVRTLEVRGAPPPLEAEVRRALQPVVGVSLLKLDGDEVTRRLGPLPGVAAATYDRGFPHTLRIHVVPERPLAVLRRGADGWLVSARGRVLRMLEHPGRSSLPRIWVPRWVSIAVGETIGEPQGARGIAALAPVRDTAFLRRVRDVRATAGELTLVLRSGLEIRLQNTSALPLKLAVARRIVPLLTPPGYLDVSVPARPVARENSQPEG